MPRAASASRPASCLPSGNKQMRIAAGSRTPVPIATASPGGLVGGLLGGADAGGAFGGVRFATGGCPDTVDGPPAGCFGGVVFAGATASPDFPTVGDEPFDEHAKTPTLASALASALVSAIAARWCAATPTYK